ncbi:MFS family permease [Novosphingobium fluoreni]|uniref:MFS family permease n=1 Tax=Novosphingobium fluoreni TaxID=1391222 RepID=A0A7W6G0I9_9SPHN|nr:MFS transporter [Novosphingobium fluoreni]MBB3941252.1 MFS family permease [Novosphingobium fluoreni]
MIRRRRAAVPATAEYQFAAHERPTMPGSPANPAHPGGRRIAYFAIGILIGITGGLGNALVGVNLNFAQGTLGLDSDQAAMLTAVYLMTNTTANLLLVKYRQQFGLQPFIRYMLPIYAAATMLHLVAHGFWSSIAVRAASGFSASAMSTLTLLYIMQSMSAPKRLAGVMMGISVPQLAMPLARALSPGLLVSGDWHMLYWCELGLTLASLAAIMSLPLPPSERTKSFEKGDFLTFALLAPGLWLLIAVLTEGRIEWWTERAWMGWGLAASLVLVGTALLIETRRANPLINVRWLGTREMMRLILVAVAVRILLSEQAFGSVGLLTALGMINDQMVTLNIVIIIASIAGIVTAVFSFDPADPSRAITLAVLLIALGAFMDASATSLSRPSSFYLSQALIGFASMLFLAHAMVIGISRTLLAGPKHFVSFVVLFGLSQSLGGIAGTALLGTFQIVREKFHSHELVQSIVLTDPLVAARVRGTGASVANVIGDPTLTNAEGAALLTRTVSREANVLAFNDVFLLIGVLAILTFLWSLSIRASIRRRGETSPVIQLQQRSQAAAAAAAEESTR